MYDNRTKSRFWPRPSSFLQRRVFLCTKFRGRRAASAKGAAEILRSNNNYLFLKDIFIESAAGTIVVNAETPAT
ncbi:MULTISPECIES: hypothetical protein [Pseudomonas]|uniref:hypothetical protein n=1 Tax=Pseudomonas TaxID=286 RepID=UPI00114D3D06|nr:MULTISPECIES: hypothetical protein [Pseudomonas]MBH3431670.1 hypothetical protein [Pseudomonas citronellolis]